MHKQLHQEHRHGIREDLHWYKGETVNFEAFDLADVMIIGNCQLNKLYFMQYYTELNINAENPDLTINKTEYKHINAQALFYWKCRPRPRFRIQLLIIDTRDFQSKF